MGTVGRVRSACPALPRNPTRRSRRARGFRGPRSALRNEIDFSCAHGVAAETNELQGILNDDINTYG